jgi:hypothetical protein
VSCDDLLKLIVRVAVLQTFLFPVIPRMTLPETGNPDRHTAMRLLRVDKMPNIPSPYHMRDWRKVARDYLDLVLDPDRRGDDLPLIRWNDEAHQTFFLPSYVGSAGPEGINCMAAVVSGTLIGLDMTKYRGHDWVKMCQAYFSPQDGVYTNGIRARAGGSFWYDLFPNILFYQLADRYPDLSETQQRMRSVAEQWYRACVAMGGQTDPWTLPDIDHTAFRFETMTPVDNGRWIEPDGAAGIAWLEYMAWLRFHDPRFLTAADWCLRALQRRSAEQNPLYELLLPYGAFVATRMNAELGRTYDVAKLLNGCFEPGDRRSARWGWGVIADRFGDYDCHGLVGSVTDTDGYAFAMNTFEWAGAITPLARYDARYARAIGKWMLNLANAARLLYPSSLPADHQDCREWADRNDPASCISYEGVRKKALRFSMASADYRNICGRVTAGSYRETRKQDGRPQVIKTESVGGAERLEHIWEVPVPARGHHTLAVVAQCVPREGATRGFRFLWAGSPNRQYREVFTVTATDDSPYHRAELPQAGKEVYIKVVAAEGGGPAALSVDLLRVDTLDPAVSPFATGDALRSGGPSNLCLYGGSHVGILGAIVGKSNVEKILWLDLLKTDYFHDRAYPTYLCYNPYEERRTVRVDVGAEPKAVYDAVGHRFWQTGATGQTAITLPPDAAVVVVLVPAGGRQERREGRLLVNKVVVDYGRL